MTFLSRDTAEVEALVTDRYIESLFTARDRGAVDAPGDVELDPSIRAVAARLTGGLMRVHPSFRFEERLAARLQAVALGLTPGWPTTGGALPSKMPGSGGDPLAQVIELRDIDPLDRLDPARPEIPGGGVPRTVILGGTLASAALSIAGAAVLAWRLSHGSDPMTRAARAVHARTGGLRIS